MAFTIKKRNDFDASVRALRETAKGKEATMYTALRDLFVDILGYPKTSVVVDTAGLRGRPDITIYARGGSAESKVSWIVLEAKDERGAVATGPGRLKLFSEKAKYITVDTAFFLMVDPVMIVARGVGAGTATTADIEVRWEGLTVEAFAEAFAPLREEVAGVPATLERFREGDESLIACDALSGDEASMTAEDKLALQISQNVFFDTLSEATHMLQAAALRALAAVRPQRDEIFEKVNAFSEEYGGYEFRPYPIAIEGKVRDNREKDQAHRRDSALMRRFLVQQPALSRLTLDALPRFADRTGLDLAKEADKVERFFANETANLILARILLIRFLEDHGFFDVETPDGRVRRRYLCNGGVAAFQGMREYFDFGYTRLLEEAYRTGGHFYSAAFDETEMDWIIALSDPDLSRTVEWALFRMARFNFATARGDLMTGVYDRFLDKKQRKEQGEYYTPPSIARYILDRLDLPTEAEVLDPACGSGTFLIERYRQTVGEDADRGLATYAEGRAAVERVYGNDINPFSAVLTQIQLLWQLLAFGSELRDQGFPDLRIAERANSLVSGALYDPTQTRFGEIDRSGYDAVVGNPPYIRTARAADLEANAQEYFVTTREENGKTFRGIPIKRNAYTLFIYRALDHWCRQRGQDGPVGKIGFIVPLAFCGTDEAADLRSLFGPGGRWAIREIVDLELIWRDIFDADVLPIILIAEARPATDEEEVSIRLADDTCVVLPEGAKRATFRFDHLEEQMVRYRDLFTPDGRIATRLTKSRVQILNKLRENGTFKDAAMCYWTKQSKEGYQAVADEPTGIGAAKWERQYLIKYGLELRRNVHYVEGGGHEVFKGENVTATRLTGEPMHRNLDVTRASSPTVWAFNELLPDTLYALPLIEQVPVAAPFDPKTTAVVNTVVVMGPRADLVDVPFDAVLLSRVYSYFYVLAGRRSFLNKRRSHLYPTVVAELPWNDNIRACSTDLAMIKRSLVEACERRYEQVVMLKEEAQRLGLMPLREVVRARKGAKLDKSEAFATEPKFTLAVGEVEDEEGDILWRLPIDETGDHAIFFDDPALAALAKCGLELLDGTEVSWNIVLQAPIPVDADMVESLRRLRASFDPDAMDDVIEAEISRIDDIVGTALGLDAEDIAEIQREMSDDPFLSGVRPRYPFFRPRQSGRRLNLERHDRYGTDQGTRRPRSRTALESK